MAQQVSGSEKTLLNAIRDGDIERPRLMQWNDWQIWRRDVGRRPTAARDGRSTTTTVESALWKSIMCELYGDDWLLRLAQGGDLPEETVESSLPSVPSPVPAAGAE